MIFRFYKNEWETELEEESSKFGLFFCLLEKLFKVLTDPVSNQILQMIRVQGKMTISDILVSNIGVPRATIYRKMDKMLEVGAIQVVDTRKVRGQTEHVYGIQNIYVNAAASSEDNLKIVTMNLMGIMNLYEGYFRREDADVSRDKLLLMNYNIALDDAEFGNMLADIKKVVDGYQSKQNMKDGKLRNLYLLSAPGGNYNE